MRNKANKSVPSQNWHLLIADNCNEEKKGYNVIEIEKRKTPHQSGRGGLSQEGAFYTDLNDEAGPVMCRSRRGRATACAKALKWGPFLGSVTGRRPV